MPVNLPPVRAIRPPTSGVWSNKQVADESRRGIGTPAGTRTPVVYMVDLTDVQPTVEVLEGYLLPLAQDIKLGKYGQSSSLVVSTRNPSIRHFVELLAVQHSLPIFLAESTSPLQLAEAQPAGHLTATEQETLDAVAAFGGRVQASQVATRLRLQHTAATNRLVSLAGKGYLYRVSRPGRAGDMFLDPRVPGLETSVNNVLAALKDTTSREEYERTERLLRRTLKKRRNGDASPDSY
jgi:hypothetical protein